MVVGIVISEAVGASPMGGARGNNADIPRASVILVLVLSESLIDFERSGLYRSIERSNHASTNTYRAVPCSVRGKPPSVVI